MDDLDDDESALVESGELDAFLLDDVAGSASPPSPPEDPKRRRMPKRQVKSRRYKLKKARQAALAARRLKAARPLSPIDIMISTVPLGLTAPLRIPSPAGGGPDCMPTLCGVGGSDDDGDDARDNGDDGDDGGEGTEAAMPLMKASQTTVAAEDEDGDDGDEQPPPSLSPCTRTHTSVPPQTVRIDLSASEDLEVQPPKLQQKPKPQPPLFPAKRGRPCLQKPIIPTFIPPKGVVNFLPERGVRMIPALMPKEQKRKGKQRPAKLSKDSYQMILDVYEHFVGRQVAQPKEETASACCISRKTLDRLLKRGADPPENEEQPASAAKKPKQAAGGSKRPTSQTITSATTSTNDAMPTTSAAAVGNGSMLLLPIQQHQNADGVGVSHVTNDDHSHHHQQPVPSSLLHHNVAVQHFHHPQQQHLHQLVPPPPTSMSIASSSSTSNHAPMPMAQRPLEMSSGGRPPHPDSIDERSYVTLKPFFMPSMAAVAATDTASTTTAVSTTAGGGGGGGHVFQLHQRPSVVEQQAPQFLLPPPTSQQSIAVYSWEALHQQQQLHQAPLSHNTQLVTSVPPQPAPPLLPPTTSYMRR